MDSCIIFDMDETLIASGPIWRRAERQLFEFLERPFDEALVQQHCKGLKAADVGARIAALLGDVAETPERCGEKMRADLCASFADADIVEMPGTSALLTWLQGTDARSAIASGSPQTVIEDVVARMGWQSHFELLMSSEPLPGKPDPAVFLEVAQRMGCEPARALVIEDSLAGCQAAKAAGMTCFVVPSNGDPAIAETATEVFVDLEAMIPAIEAWDSQDQ